MRLFFIATLLITNLVAFSSVEDVTIGKFDFVIIKKSYNIYDSKGKVMKLYREEQNRNLTFILRLTLKDVTGDCSSKSLQDGTYTVDKKGITLYSFWNRGGKAYTEPYGARIQRYEIQPDASLKLVLSQVYIESARKKYDNDSGMIYLFNPPTTDKNREKLKAYVSEIEELYNATFLYGAEAKELIAKVKDALQVKIKAIWRSR
jgi:hypothetical protein